MARGTIGKRAGSWYFVHRIDDPATGERRQKWQGGFETKADADRALRDSLTATETGTRIEPTKLTYRDYVENVWLPALVLQVESSTHESYSRNMRVQGMCFPIADNSSLLNRYLYLSFVSTAKTAFLCTNLPRKLLTIQTAPAR